MKEYQIALTNLTGARNRGVEALVYSTIDGIQTQMENDLLKWSIHSNDPLYDSWRYAEFNTETFFSYLTNTPEHFDSKILNKAIYKFMSFIERFIPNSFRMTRSQTNVRASDLVVCSGGDVFTSDYGNLRKHLSFPLVSKRSYLCSHTIGPFAEKDEKYFKKCLSAFDAISVREQISYDYLKGLLPESVRLELVSDVAFSLKSKPELGKKILKEHLGIGNEKFVALSISKGVARYANTSEEKYLNEFVGFCDELLDIGYKLVLIPHVMERNPNNNDMIICRDLLLQLKSPEQVRIMSYEYSAVEFKSVIAHADCLVGARTHATIASMSQLVPTVSIAYSRKAYGIVSEVYGKDHDKVIVDAKNVNAKNLIEAFETSIKIKIDQDVMAEIKRKSQINFKIAKELLEA